MRLISWTLRSGSEQYLPIKTILTLATNMQLDVQIPANIRKFFKYRILDIARNVSLISEIISDWLSFSLLQVRGQWTKCPAMIDCTVSTIGQLYLRHQQSSARPHFSFYVKSGRTVTYFSIKHCLGHRKQTCGMPELVQPTLQHLLTVHVPHIALHTK